MEDRQETPPKARPERVSHEILGVPDRPANCKQTASLMPAALRRAKKLARSGECRSLAEIMRRLQIEGYISSADELGDELLLLEVARILRRVDQS